jgi:hypothetical protein
MAKKFTSDYSAKLIDATGRELEVSINGASIDEMVATGLTQESAREEVEQNAFQNAIARGEISADCHRAA